MSRGGYKWGKRKEFGIHLQLETIDIEIWNIMRHINLSYSKYFNNRYNFIGQLYQGRYKSEVIENDIYMGSRESEILTENKILSYFKDNSRELYKRYVEYKLLIEGMSQEIKEEVGVV